MRTRMLSLVLIAALGGVGIAPVMVTTGKGRQRVELHARLDNDPGPASQSRRFRSFERLPDDMGGWFRFDGDPQQMQGAIDELRRRMEELERRLGQSQPPSHGRTDRI